MLLPESVSNLSLKNALENVPTSLENLQDIASFK